MRGAATVCLALLLTLGAGCDEVTYVDRVVLVNRTDYDVVVDVTGSGDGGWLPLGLARQGQSTVWREVADQGPTWVFRFGYGGADAGWLTISRAELARGGWRVEVPQDAANRLRAKGIVPPP